MNSILADRLPLRMESGVYEGGHVQGIALDLTRGFVYYSFTRSLVKTDLSGNVLGSVKGLTGHLGCIAYNREDGKVYGSLEYKAQTAFYIAIFDVSRIDRMEMDAEKDGVMTTVYLTDVVRDFTTDLDGDGFVVLDNGQYTDKNPALSLDHKYGCSGIDGVSFGPVFGAPADSPYQLMVAYGIYENLDRADNDYQVFLQYDWRKFAALAKPLTQSDPHQSGLQAEERYFLYTGNTCYGVQNLEYDTYTGNWFASAYRGHKPHCSDFTLFVIDGSKVPVKGEILGQTPREEGLLLSLAPIGKCHAETGVYGGYVKDAATGIFSLGNGYFYIARHEMVARDPKRYTAHVKLYQYTGDENIMKQVLPAQTIDFAELLKGDDNCACGRPHHCATKYIFIEEGATRKLTGVLGDYHKVLLAADQNTWAVAGAQTEAAVKAAGLPYDKKIFVCEGFLVPDEASIEALTAALTDDVDLIIGIGSGVINDLCKYVSFTRKMDYMIVATAPSMDGYASNGAAMIIDHGKVTYNAHVPTGIIADVDVLRNAPMPLIQSGYGDIVGKFSALNDWEIARVMTGEYFCEKVYNVVMDTVERTVALAADLQKRTAESITTLMQGLVLVGIEMSFVTNSRPASGSEHHLSHFFEVMGLMEDSEYFLHGTDVAYGTVVTAGLRRDLIANPPAKKDFDEAAWEAEVRAIYGVAADGILALQRKTGHIYRDFAAVYAEKRAEVEAIFAKHPSAKEVADMLRAAGIEMPEFPKMYGGKRIADAVKYAKYLKDRFSVLWLTEDYDPAVLDTL